MIIKDDIIVGHVPNEYHPGVPPPPLQMMSVYQNDTIAHSLIIVEDDP